MRQPNGPDVIDNNDKGKKAGAEHAGVLVRIQEYDPGHHRLKVVREDTGLPLRKSKWTEEEIEQQFAYQHRTAKTLKTLPGKNGPVVEVNDEMAFIQGSAKDGFFTTQKYGNIIKGPLSIEAKPHEIRLSGITILNPLLLSGFPSTIVTPLPTTIFNIPGATLAGTMGKDVAIMAGIIAAGGL